MKSILISVILSIIIAVPVFAKQNINVIINGEKQYTKEYNINFNKNDIIPFSVRHIAEKLGYHVHFNNDTNTLYIIENSCILYENETLGIGFIAPDECQNNYYKILENEYDNYTVIQFLDAETDMLVFSFAYIDLEYWDDEMKESFSIPYTEIFKNNDTLLLSVSVSDVQYDTNDTKQKNRYLKLLHFKQKICDNIYTFQY